MKRNDFLKVLGGGVVGVALVPQVLKAGNTINSENNEKLPRVAIDHETISRFTIGGRKISAAEILQIFQETGILIYKSIPGHKAPIVLQGEIKGIKV